MTSTQYQSPDYDHGIMYSSISVLTSALYCALQFIKFHDQTFMKVHISRKEFSSEVLKYVYSSILLLKTKIFA